MCVIDYLIWPIRLSARTQDFHSWKRGSIPLWATVIILLNGKYITYYGPIDKPVKSPLFQGGVTGSSPVGTTKNYLTVCTRTGGLDFSIIRDGNWLVSIKPGNKNKYCTKIVIFLDLDSLFAFVAQLVVAPHL